ncbi:MAG: hypothetical protein MUF87_04285 [Anaerolineae bacterium]|jgi:hypothetical protein|nr:hypothetical protein [Anaerolineae bacterium]
MSGLNHLITAKIMLCITLLLSPNKFSVVAATAFTLISLNEDQSDDQP